MPRKNKVQKPPPALDPFLVISVNRATLTGARRRVRAFVLALGWTVGVIGSILSIITFVRWGA